MASTDYASDRGSRLAREAVQRQWTGGFSPLRHVDPLLLLSVLALCAFGLVVIYSATQGRLTAAEMDPMRFVNRQALSLALGLGVVGAVMAVDYRLFRAWAPLLYVVTLGSLVAVLLMGSTEHGATRWLELWGVRFQPAEIAKPALVLMLAALFHERREEALGLRALVEALIIAALPIVLILLQPDLGTAMVFVATTFGVLLMARVRVRYMCALVVIGIASMVGSFQLGVLQEYQLERLNTFLGGVQSADLQGAAYNVNQAEIAVGSGQLSGQGLLQGTQTSLSFVPENHTDFIFTVIGEELGFLGATVLLALYAMFLWRALVIAATARDTLGTLIAAGVASIFAFQMFTNIGMTVGVMPVTGLPLPFVSYGGTNLIGSLLMVGLLQNVAMRRYS